MVKIPDSYGMVAKPTTQTQIAMPDNGSQLTAQTMQQVSGNLMNMAVQMEYINQREQESFNASQLIDFKTELSRFENEKRVALTELPSTDAKAIETAKTQFITDRQKFVDEYSNKYRDNKQVSDLIKRQANAESVDFEYDVNRVISGKKKEYGQNAIYKSIYDINNRLQNGGSISKLGGQLQETLQTGLKAGLIDQQDIIRETEKQKNIIEELQRQYEKTRYANLIADGKMQIDPSNSDDRKLGDLAYQTTLQKTSKQGIDPMVASMNFIQKTGFVPSNVKGIWSTQLNIGTPQQKLTTASNIASLIDENPRLQNQFNADDVSFAMEIKKRANAGLPPAQVLDYAEKEVSKYQSMDRIAKTQIIAQKDFKKAIDSNYKDLIGDYNSIFSRNPAVEDGIKTTFEQIVRDQFLNNKNATLDGSIEFAKNQIKNEFTTTEIGQKKVMRYAPETFYKQYNGGDTSWIKGQFASKVAEHTLLPNFDTIDKDFSLIPHPNFIAGGKPAYFITQNKGNNGRMDIMLDAFNRPVLFAPNMEETQWYQDTQKEYNKKRKTPLTRQEMLQILEDKATTSDFTKAVRMGSKGRFAEISTESLIDRPQIKKVATEKTVSLIDKIKNFDYNQPIESIKTIINNYGKSFSVYQAQMHQAMQDEYKNFLSESEMPKIKNDNQKPLIDIKIEDFLNVDLYKRITNQLPEIQQKIQKVMEYQKQPDPAPAKVKEITKLNIDIEGYKKLYNDTMQEFQIGKKALTDKISNAYNDVVNSFTQKQIETTIKDKINSIKEKSKEIAPATKKAKLNQGKLNPQIDYTVDLFNETSENTVINFLKEFPNIRKLRQKAIEDISRYRTQRQGFELITGYENPDPNISYYRTATFSTMAYAREIQKIYKIDKDLAFLIDLDFTRQTNKTDNKTGENLKPTNYFKPRIEGFKLTDFWSEENLGSY